MRKTVLICSNILIGYNRVSKERKWLKNKVAIDAIVLSPIAH